MHITDARTGRRTEVLPRRAGLLRVTVHAGWPGDHPDNLRVLLVGDLLARTAETGGLQVVTQLSAPTAEDGQITTLLRDAGRIGIRPPADTTTQHTADLHIAAHRRPLDDDGGLLLAVGPIVPSPSDSGSAAVDSLGGISLDGLEPLALRLAMLGHAHQVPARLTAAPLADAQAQLIRWRALVADLANYPSKPVLADAVQAAFEGFNDDLNARPALGTLHELETRTDLPPGSRFETYLRIDQVLALELGRDIGRPLNQPWP